MAKNITEVRLLNVPLESDYKHSLYFANATDQASYFISKTIFSATDFSYQRKDNIIRYPKHFDDLLNCNYVMYRNSAYSSKWFYAFIKDMTYINDERTDITIETDVIQTYLFDYSIKPSFVEREHVLNDSPGDHTIPEGLETGEYISDGVHYFEPLLKSGFILATTVDLSTGSRDSNSPGESDKKAFKAPNYANISVPSQYYNGIPSGVLYYYFNNDNTMPDNGGIKALNQVLWALADAGQSDAVVSIFTVPGEMIETVQFGNFNYIAGDASFPLLVVKPQAYSFSEGWGSSDSDMIPRATSLNGYTPRNKKLLTFPYCYLMMDNNAGGSACYHYEYFKNDNGNRPLFNVVMAVTPGCSIRAYPLFYKGIMDNNSEGLNAGKFPICAWSTDVYTNWLTQNGVNIGISLISSSLQVASGVALAASGGGAMAGASMITSGALGIASTMGEKYQRSLQPPQAEGNLNSGDVTFANGMLTFFLYHMSIKKEYAKIIDDYFSMFGYKVNDVKVPNSNHRENYWYTKTIDASIDGAIPQRDLQIIKDCYNQGITFWRSGSVIGDYSVSNNIK